MSVLAIDIGATKISAGFADSEDMRKIVATPQTASELIKSVVDLVYASADRFNVTKVAVACPGLIDFSGKIVAALYLPLSEIPLRSILGDSLDCPVGIWNDAHAQAVGCVNENESLCYLTFGTGVGGAIVLHNRGLVRGSRGFAGELGHVRAVYEAAITCACGREGCLDSVASGRSLERMLGQQWWARPSGKTRAALREAGRAAALVLSNSMIQLDPDRLVLAGHIVGDAEFQAGFGHAWQDPTGIWGLIKPEFVTATWPFASRGLTRLALAE